MHPRIDLLGYSIPLFNVFMCLAIFVGVKLFEREESLYNKHDQYLKNKKELLLAGLIFGSIASAIIFENIYHDDFGYIGRYGMTFYGGVIFGLLFLYVFSKFSTQRFFLILNIFMPAVLLSHTIGRLGCFFAGCCYGPKTDSFIGMYFLDNVKRVPTQLFEALFLLLYFFIMLKYIKFNHRTIFYFLAYPISRFILEFWRDDERGDWGINQFSPSQNISIFFIVITTLFALCKSNLFKRNRNYS